MKTLVLGLGNELLADEGVGVHAVRALVKKGVAENVTVLDIGVNLLDAIPELETPDHVIIVDAMKAGGHPGTVYRLGFGECVVKEYVASMHGFDIARVFALAQRKDIPEITVIGVEPDRIDWSMALSGAVAASLPAVVEAVEREINSEAANIK